MTTDYEVSCVNWGCYSDFSPWHVARSGQQGSSPLLSFNLLLWLSYALDNSEVLGQFGKQQHLDSSAPGVLCHGDLILWQCFMVIGQDGKVVARRQRAAPEGSAKKGFGSDKDPMVVHCGKLISKETSSSSSRQDFTKQGLVGILPSASSAATPVVDLQDSLGWWDGLHSKIMGNGKTSSLEKRQARLEAPSLSKAAVGEAWGETPTLQRHGMYALRRWANLLIPNFSSFSASW